MAIHFQAENKCFTLHTEHTTYQIKVDAHGLLKHQYYGRKVIDTDFDYAFLNMDRGFSGNPYDCDPYERSVSLDTMPQEYTSSDVGDYRLTSLNIMNADGSYGTNLRYDSYEILNVKYSIPGLPAAYAEKSDTVETLIITLKDHGTKTTVKLYYGVFSEKDVITRCAVIINESTAAVHLEKVMSACLDLPFGSYDLIHFHGRHCMERQVERMPVSHSIQTVSSMRDTSSHQHNPFVILAENNTDEDQGDCYGIMLAYSGNFRMDVEQDQFGSVRIQAGIHDEKFSWQLKEGECFYTPEVILSYTNEGLGALSRQYHQMIQHNITRGKYHLARRPLLINNWEATGFQFNEEKILSIAAQAAGLGIEMFVLDDGWFGKRDSDNAGLGDWKVNLEKLPHGIHSLAENINAMGMKFGIWVEPESINEDSDLYRAHPDWALKTPSRRPVRSRNQLVLDLSRKEVCDYLFEQLSELLSSANIEYIKWDMNRSLCDIFSTEQSRDQGETSHRYVLGLYSLLDRLISSFPDVLFEGCSGGGGRFDAGMLYYTPQIWNSDDTDPIHQLKIQYGTSFGYPVSAMGTHVSCSPNMQSGRSTPFTTRAVSALSGTFGYELDPNALSTTEKEEIRSQISLFKQYNDLIHYGRLYRISNPFQDHCFAVKEFVSPDQSEALVNVIATDPQANPPLLHIKFKGLNENWLYRYDDKEMILSGAALMYAGYTIPAMPGDYSILQIHLTHVEEKADE